MKSFIQLEFSASLIYLIVLMLCRIGFFNILSSVYVSGSSNNTTKIGFSSFYYVISIFFLDFIIIFFVLSYVRNKIIGRFDDKKSQNEERGSESVPGN